MWRDNKNYLVGNMENNKTNIYEKLKKLKSFQDFPNIFVSKTISGLKPDTVYISCTFEEIDSTYNIDYKITNNIENRYGSKPDINGVHIFSRDNDYICTFIPEFNSLILDEKILFEKNADRIFRSVIDIINRTKKQEEELFKRNLIFNQDLRIASGNRLHNHIIKNIKHRRLWHLKKLFSGSDKYPILILHNKCFTLEKYATGFIVQDVVVDEITKSAMKTIDNAKRNYIEKLAAMKKIYANQLENNIPIPNISLYNIIKNRLMISRYGNGIIYSFIVDITVDIALDEQTLQYIRLNPPFIYKDHILALYISSKNRLVKIELYDNNGRHSNHPHTDKDMQICTGSLSKSIMRNEFQNFEEILKLKNHIIVVLSKFNICNYNRHLSKHIDIVNKVHMSDLRIEDNQGIIFKPDMVKEPKDIR